MDQTPHERFNQLYVELAGETATYDIKSEEFTASAKNLEIFTRCTPPVVDPELAPTPTPNTRWGKVKHGVARVWDNETTRVFVKAAGAFGGVWYVAHTTIHKDHVLERQAFAQANQKPS